MRKGSLEDSGARFEAKDTSRREDVVAVQFILRKRARHGTRPYYAREIDGRFGRRTRNAIAHFQHDGRIEKDLIGEVHRGGPTSRALAEQAGEGFYTGLEDPVAFAGSAGTGPGDIFEIRPPNIPADATPIVNDDPTILGYRTERYGLIEILDLDGNSVHREELGLESPLLDPSLLLPVGGLAMLPLRRLLSVAATRSVARGPARLGLEIERAFFRPVHRIMQTPIRFSGATAGHMHDPGRYVPVHILRLAIRYGRRVPDPKGARGAVLYRVPMFRQGKR